jgi:hypothetical protein
LAKKDSSEDDFTNIVLNQIDDMKNTANHTSTDDANEADAQENKKIVDED